MQFIISKLEKLLIIQSCADSNTSRNLTTVNKHFKNITALGIPTQDSRT